MAETERAQTNRLLKAIEPHTSWSTFAADIADKIRSGRRLTGPQVDAAWSMVRKCADRNKDGVVRGTKGRMDAVQHETVAKLEGKSGLHAVLLIGVEPTSGQEREAFIRIPHSGGEEFLSGLMEGLRLSGKECRIHRRLTEWKSQPLSTSSLLNLPWSVAVGTKGLA